MFVWDTPLWERRCVGTHHPKTPSHCLCEPTRGLQPADPPLAAAGHGRCWQGSDTLRVSPLSPFPASLGSWWLRFVSV